MQLTNNTILITGATSGIGYAFMEEFVKLGNKVIVCARREDRLKKIKEKHPGVITKICDAANTKQREELIGWLLQNYPDVNVLINNAGIQLANDLTHPLNPDRIRDEMEINFIAPAHLATMLAQHFAGKKESAIINITSGLSFVPMARVPVYCASKAAFHSLTLSLRYQLRNTPVKVFEIIPPSVDSELGHENRKDPNQSHGGMALSEFIQEAIPALKNDILEAPIGQAKNIREKGEEIFARMNP
jgi:uncharacterized oxidoreductase